AAVIETLRGPGNNLNLEPIQHISRGGPLPASSAQQRLWFLDQLEGASGAYNMSGALMLHGDLDVSALKRSLNAMVCRHESLRTTFPAIEGLPAQVIAEELILPLPLVELTGRGG